MYFISLLYLTARKSNTKNTFLDLFMSLCRIVVLKRCLAVETFCKIVVLKGCLVVDFYAIKLPLKGRLVAEVFCIIVVLKRRFGC